MKPKRAISLLLAGCMAVSMVPASAVTAFAEEAGTVPSLTAPATVKVKVTLDGTKTLQQAVQDENSDLTSITELKVITTGSAALTKDDFQFMSGVVVSGTAETRYKPVSYTPSTVTCLTNLEKVDLSEAACVDNEIPARAFNGNTKITKIILPVNLNRVGIAAFGGMTNLEFLSTSDENNLHFEGLKIMGESMVYGDKKLTGDLVLPTSLERLSASAFEGSGVGGDIFINGNIDIEDNIDYVNLAGAEFPNCKRVFYGTNITSIEFGKGIKKIYNDFAAACPNLATVKFPDSLEEIGPGAFMNSGLTGTVVIPATVKKIDEYTFNAQSAPASYKVDNFIIESTEIELSKCCFANVKYGTKLYFTSMEGIENPTSTDEKYWYDSQVVVLNTNGGKIDPSESADEKTGLFTPKKDGYTFEGWYEDENFAGNPATTIDPGKTYYAKWHHNADLKADVDNSEASQKGVLVNEPVEVTVKLEPNEDNIDDVLNGTGYAAFDFSDPDAVAFVECGGVKFTGEELKARNYKIQISELMAKAQSGIETYSTNPAIVPGTLAITMKIAYNKEGNHKLAVAVLNSSSNLICSSEKVLIKVIKPEEPKKDDDKKEDTNPENPVTTYALTVKGGTVKVNDKDTVANDGVIAVEKDAKVEVTFDKSTLSDAQVFDQWTITPDSVLNAVDPKAETITFTMPAEKVTVEAMTKDATIEDDGPDILGTAAMIGVGVAGTAVLGYQGYMLGTELYLNSVLPAGTAIPQNTAELAKLVWTEAGKPEPVALLAADATEEQKALTWAVENQLISADKAADASVTRWEVIQTWNKAQEMKG